MALSNLPATRTANFNSELRAVLDEWKTGIEGKAEIIHSHGEGGVVMSICDNEANLGTGSTDGEVKQCSDNPNWYKWDTTAAKWRIMPGNIYATEPSGSTYLIETNTLVMVAGELMRWNGFVFVEAVNGIPVGTSIMVNGSTVPDGFLKEDGAAYSRTTYAALFAHHGTRYGEGDTVSTFNVDNKCGRFIRGWDDGAGVDPDAASRTDSGGGVTGDNPGSKQGGEIQSHTHQNRSDMTKWDGSYWDVYANGSGSGELGHIDFNNSFDTLAEGGNETRPVNTSVMFCVKY